MKRVVRTKRLVDPPESPAIRSWNTWRRRGKFSNVRNSSASSSRNVTGAPERLRAPWKNATSESNASRGDRASADTSGAVKGEAISTVRSRRSGVVAERSMSMYWQPDGPSRSRSRRSRNVRPVPQPPTSTGIRAGRASSAESTRRSNPGRAMVIARPSSRGVSSAA